jgi:hypothetical protein
LFAAPYAPADVQYYLKKDFGSVTNDVNGANFTISGLNNLSPGTHNLQITYTGRPISYWPNGRPGVDGAEYVCLLGRTSGSDPRGEGDPNRVGGWGDEWRCREAGYGGRITVVVQATDKCINLDGQQDTVPSDRVESPAGSKICLLKVRVQGRVLNAFTNGPYFNVVVSDCRGNTDVTDNNGEFTFDKLEGDQYCIQVSGGYKPGDYYDTRAKPAGVGYSGCTQTAPAGYCNATYYADGQRAGQSVGGVDRSWDSGYDLVFTTKPQIECRITAPGSVIVGDQYAPEAFVTRLGNATNPPYASGQMTVNVPGASTSGTYATNVSGGIVTFTPSSVLVTTAASFTPTGTASGSYGTAADWWRIPADDDTCDNTGGGRFSYAPYMKIYGSDVWSGGNYGTTNCTPDAGQGSIYGFAEGNGSGGYRGSSAQLTVTSLLNINQFYSVSNRIGVGNTFPPKGLTIANTGAGTYGAANAGAEGRCIADYYTDTQDESLTARGDSDFPPPDVPGTPYIPPGPPIPQPPIPVNMFYWTYAGPNSNTPPTVAGYPYCVRFDASSTDSLGWGDNWLCSRINLNLTWFIKATNATPIPYPYFQVIYEPSDNYTVTKWDYRYVLASTAEPSPYRYTWINNASTDPSIAYGQPGARSCVRIIEPAEPAGNSWGDNWLCAPWYMQPQPSLPGSPAVPAGPPTPGAFPAGRSRYMLSSRTINALSIPRGSQVAAYVDGDVFINGNITFSTDARTTNSDIPYFALIARGNIYISENVSRLDGLYIAQPRSGGGTGGKIYTCARGMGDLWPGVAAAPNDLYTKCNKQLAINGALVAKQVRWLRTFGNINDGVYSNASPNEAPDFSTGLGGNTKAGEIVSYTPEMYMAPSPLKSLKSRDGSGEVGRRYDAITGLPPIF